jgi:hypothetical protein
MHIYGANAETWALAYGDFARMPLVLAAYDSDQVPRTKAHTRYAGHLEVFASRAMSDGEAVLIGAAHLPVAMPSGADTQGNKACAQQSLWGRCADTGSIEPVSFG